MAPDFNHIARFYYPLSRVVFGSSQEKAQQAFTPLIRPGSRILIVGGGNGQLLILLLQPSAQKHKIFLVEPAGEMIAMARKKATPSTHLHFIQTTVEQFLGSSKEHFDVVITAFFFDLFTQAEADNLFSIINNRLNPEGLWLYTDFQLKKSASWWQRPILKMMYAFFRRVSGVRASSLPDMSSHWENDYELLGIRTFYGEFIITRAWRRHEDMRVSSLRDYAQTE